MEDYDPSEMSNKANLIPNLCRYGGNAYFYLFFTIRSSHTLSNAHRGYVLPVMVYFFKSLAIYNCHRLFPLVGHDSSEAFQKLRQQGLCIFN